MRVLIVGGVAGGASTAVRLRRLNEASQIVVFERGEHISFANCGLPYYCGDVIKDRDKLVILSPQDIGRMFNIDARVESEVLAIDRAAKTIMVRDRASGHEYGEGYDKLVLSLGAAPLRPPLPGIEDGRIFTLRSLEDADRIKAYVERLRRPGHSPHAVIVGGGFIGVEMAESLAHTAGCRHPSWRCQISSWSTSTASSPVRCTTTCAPRAWACI